MEKILPELYQPIYGHPEFDKSAQRNCRDRLKHIYKVYDALEKELQRTLREKFFARLYEIFPRRTKKFLVTSHILTLPTHPKKISLRSFF